VPDPAGGEPLPPAWGWRQPYSGRAAHVDRGVEWTATTVQACGLWPYTLGAGSPLDGTVVGRHQMSGEVVCLDPLSWMTAGLVTNPNMFLLGQPGTGKSTLVKRLAMGAVSRGDTVLVLGDVRPDYVAMTQALGGQVIRVGRGLHRINPLDPGPLGSVLSRLPAAEAAAARIESRGRRLALLMALCTLIRGGPLDNAEEVVLGAALDVLDERLDVPPVIPDVLRILDEGPAEMQAAARARGTRDYRRQVAPVCFTLSLLLRGTLGGAFDGPTSVGIDVSSPMVTVDISGAGRGGAGDQMTAAAMLCTWAAGTAVADASALLARANGTRRTPMMMIMDELWLAIRAAPGIVQYVDMLSRMSRRDGAAAIYVTHTVSDLEALASEEDRAVARGLIDRCSIIAMAALPPRELQQLTRIVPMTGPEQDLVAAWSAPDSWAPGSRHPGRGKYLIKSGGRLGLPVDLSLVPAEVALYDTDQAVRSARTAA
jgi:hypothetical protein